MENEKALNNDKKCEEVEGFPSSIDSIETLSGFSIEKHLFEELKKIVGSSDFIIYRDYYEQAYVNMKL